MKRYSEIQRNLGVLIVGILFLCGAIIAFFQGIELKEDIRKFEDKSKATVALVQKIELDEIGNVETIYIAYKVGDITYTDVKLPYEVTEVAEGEGIEIYYNKNNPELLYEKFYTDSSDLVLIWTSFFLAMVGGIFLFVSLGFVSRFSKMNKVEYMAEVTDIYMDRNVRINHRHPYRVECKVYDSYTGQTYLYRSGAITRDLSNVNLQTVKVYVDEKNRKKYYVDVEGTLKELNMY